MEENNRDAETVKNSIFIVNENPPPIGDFDDSPGIFPPGATLLLFLEVFRCYASTSFKNVKFLLSERCGYSEVKTSRIFCFIAMMGIIFPIIGSVIADNWMGKFKAFLFGSFLAMFGFIFITISSIQSLYIPVIPLFWIGIAFHATGWGYMSPTFIPLAADQFKLPVQRPYLSCFFSIEYGITNVVTCACIIFAPIFVAWSSYGDKQSYFVVFLLAAIGMTIIVIFLICYGWILDSEVPTVSIAGDVIKCIFSAISNRIKYKMHSREHWIYCAEGKYKESFLKDVKCVLNLMLVLLPSIIIWSILRQFESRCTAQAIRMDLMVFGYLIKPFQILFFDTVVSCILILVCHTVIFQILKENNCHKPLSKMLIGGVMIGIALVISGVLELFIEDLQKDMLEPGRGQLRIYNGMDCDYTFINLPGQKEYILKSLKHYQNFRIKLYHSKTYNITAIPSKQCGRRRQSMLNFTVNVQPNKASAYYFTGTDKPVYFRDVVKKSHNAHPYLRILTNGALNDDLVTIRKDNCTIMEDNLTNMEIRNIFPGIYNMYFQNQLVMKDMGLLVGGAYVLLVLKMGSTYTVNLITYVKPNGVHILWQLPQLLIFVTGEIMFIVSGMEFVYLESPKAMSAFMWSYYNFLDAIGHVLIALFATSRLDMSSQFFLNSGILAIILIIKRYLVKRYEYVNDILKKD